MLMQTNVAEISSKQLSGKTQGGSKGKGDGSGTETPLPHEETPAMWGYLGWELPAGRILWPLAATSLSSHIGSKQEQELGRREST